MPFQSAVFFLFEWIGGSALADPAQIDNAEGVTPNTVEYITKDIRAFQPSAFIGLQANHPLTKGYLVGAGMVYMLNDKLGVSADALYCFDRGENDLKPLPTILVQIAESSSSSSTEFQVPIDKIAFQAGGGLHYELFSNNQTGLIFAKPFVGIGLGVMSVKQYYGVYDEIGIALNNSSSALRLPLKLNYGSAFWSADGYGVKLRFQNLVYRALEPQYDPDVISNDNQLYSHFLATLELVFG